MGRGSSGGAAVQPQVARRSVQPTPPGTPVRDTAAPRPRRVGDSGLVFNLIYREGLDPKQYYVPESHIPGVKVPSCTIHGQPFFPQTGPTGSPKLTRLYAALWKTLVRAGFPKGLDELGEHLFLKEEISTETVGIKARGGPRALKGDELRPHIREFQYRMNAPITAHALEGGRRGTRVAINRAEVDKEVESLSKRVQNMMRSKRGVEGVARRDRWWGGDRELRYDTSKWKAPLVWGLVQALDSRRLKGVEAAELCARLNGDAIEEWVDEVGGEERRACSKFREFIADLRIAGAPILATPGGNGGYWIADSAKECNSWLEGQQGRIDATRSRRESLHLAGVFWYPQTADEREIAARFRSKHWPAVPPSPEAQEAERKRKAAIEARDAEKQARLAPYKDEAGRWLTKLADDYSDKAARHKTEIRKFRKTGKLPRMVKGKPVRPWDPRRDPAFSSR